MTNLRSLLMAKPARSTDSLKISTNKNTYFFLKIKSIRLERIVIWIFYSLQSTSVLSTINWILPVGLSLMIIRYNGHFLNKLISLANRKRNTCRWSSDWIADNRDCFSTLCFRFLLGWLLIKMFRIFVLAYSACNAIVSLWSSAILSVFPFFYPSKSKCLSSIRNFMTQL